MKKLLAILLVIGLSASLYSVDVLLQPASMSTKIKADSGGNIVDGREYLDLNAKDPFTEASYKDLLQKSALGLIITVLKNQEDQAHYYIANYASPQKYFGGKQTFAEYFYIPKASAKSSAPVATFLADSTDLSNDTGKKYLDIIMDMVKAGQAQVKSGKARDGKAPKGGEAALKKALGDLGMWHLKGTDRKGSDARGRKILALEFIQK